MHRKLTPSSYRLQTGTERLTMRVFSLHREAPAIVPGFSFLKTDCIEPDLLLFSRASAPAILPHGGNLSEVFRPAFRRLRSAFRPERSGSGFERIGKAISQVF